LYIYYVIVSSLILLGRELMDVFQSQQCLSSFFTILPIIVNFNSAKN